LSVERIRRRRWPARSRAIVAIDPIHTLSIVDSEKSRRFASPIANAFCTSLGCCWRMQLQSYAQIGQSLFENQELRDPGRSALTFNSLRYVARHGDRAKHLAFGLVFDDREGHLDV
jgi:hypothetical protein